MERSTVRIRGDARTLHAVLGIYCRDKHASTGTLCSGCRELLDYAMARLFKCPFGEKKPVCAQCTIHCYQPAMRARIREVMKYSGPRMLTTNPILAVQHIVHSIRRGGHKPWSPSAPPSGKPPQKVSQST